MTRNPFQDGDIVHAPGLNAAVNGLNLEGVKSGCTPSKGTGDWDVDVASGAVFVNSTDETSVGSATKTLTAPSNDADLDAGEARVDLVTVDSTGTVNVTEGTASSGDKLANAPDIPANEVLIAAVFVDGDATSLSSSDINDYRSIIKPQPPVPAWQEDGNSPLEVNAATSATYTLAESWDHILILARPKRGFTSLQINGDTGTNYDYTTESGTDTNGASKFPLQEPTARYYIFLSSNSAQSIFRCGTATQGDRIVMGRNGSETGGITKIKLLDPGPSDVTNTYRIYGLNV